MKATPHAATIVGVIGIVGLMSTAAIAQSDQQRVQNDQQQAESLERSSGLVRDVRRATQEFQNVAAAIAAGYVSTRSCVSGPSGGAMGVHYVNEAFIADGVLDVQRPEVLVYEPDYGGRLRLAAIEFFVDADQWNGANAGPPVLGGQHFNFVSAPNRLRNPAYYELHVWAWKRNSDGVFSDWNPAVSCAGYVGETSTETTASGAAHGH
jgi:hypothetical protein